MMTFNANGAFNSLMPSNQSTTPIISEEGHSEAVRLLPGGSPLFGQFPFPAGLPQAAAMQAMAASAAASGLPYPAVFFSSGMQTENLSLGGGPYSGLLLDGAAGFHPYGGFDGVRRKNATRETTAPLKNWLTEHRKNPYPTKAEKLVLALMTKMTLTQVSTWFANARRRLKKENKMTWSPQNRRGDDDDDDLADIDAIDRPSSSTSGGSDRKDDSEILSGMNNNMKTSLSTENSPTKKLVNNKIWSIADTISPNATRTLKDEVDEKPSAETGSSKKEGLPTLEGLTPEQMQAFQQQMLAMAARFPMFAAMQGLRPPNGPTAPPPFMFNPMSLIGLNVPNSLINGNAPSELAASSSPSPAPSSKNGGSGTPSPNGAQTTSNQTTTTPVTSATTSSGAVNLSTTH